MTFSVCELPKAIADVRKIVAWLYERSPQGSESWLDAYDSALARLKINAASNRLAFENDAVAEIEVRQALFKTKHGRVYRILYFVEGDSVFVLPLVILSIRAALVAYRSACIEYAL